MNKIDKKFLDSISQCVQDNNIMTSNEYVWVAFNYVVRGLPPGGMFSSIFANDMVTASCKSHPNNDWNQLLVLFRWLNLRAPGDCWGDYNKVDEWCKLDDETRIDICEKAGILSTSWDILKQNDIT